MAKRKKKDVYKANIAVNEFMTTTTRTFALGPEYLDEVLEILRENLPYPGDDPGLTPLEYILGQLEKQARKILSSRGYPTDLDELWWLKREHSYPVKFKSGGGGIKCDLDIESRSARTILFSARNLRDDIANNDAESAAIEMMRILFAAFRSEMYQVIMTGIQLKAGQKRGGKKSKKAKGIELAVETLLKNSSKKMSKEQVWRYFKQHYNMAKSQNPMEIGDYEISFDEFIGSDVPDLLFEQNKITGKQKSIKKETFFRHYMKKLGTK
jgi:hypothetical protein